MQPLSDDSQVIANTPGLKDTPDELCAHFDAELARQRAVLEGCRSGEVEGLGVPRPPARGMDGERVATSRGGG